MRKNAIPEKYNKLINDYFREGKEFDVEDNLCLSKINIDMEWSPPFINITIYFRNTKSNRTFYVRITTSRIIWDEFNHSEKVTKLINRMIINL